MESPPLIALGKDFWHTVPIPRLGVPSLRTSDGPNGVRGTRFFNSIPAACFPCATALGSTFDAELLFNVGKSLGRECKEKGVHVLLGPTMNIQRGPLGGRGFESFSEDPCLSGQLAGQYCKGVQSEDVIATPKHFVCNDQEHERMAVNSIVTKRALREIYLMPFMLAIKAANPGAIMTAYNKVNGIHASENHYLLDILRKEWRWNGLVMSDWFGTYSTSEGINAGQDLEMPGPTKWRGDLLSHAMKCKTVKSHVLDDRVRAVLETVKLAAKSGILEDAPEMGSYRPEDQGLLRRVAAESIVLLKNTDDILPFVKDKEVAVIGPNAKIASYAGGGSACLTPYYAITPYEGVCGKTSQVYFAEGAQTHNYLPLLDSQIQTSDGQPGFDFLAYDKPHGSTHRKLLDRLHLTNSEMFIADYEIPGHDSPILYVDIDGVFVPDETAEYAFGLTVQGEGQLFMNDVLLIDNTMNQKLGTAFFGGGTVEKKAIVRLKEQEPFRLHARFGTSPELQHFGKGGIRLGCAKQMDSGNAIHQAVVLATRVKQVVVFAGLNRDLESESFDRPNMDLPTPSDDLIKAVLAVNPNAVIVIQSGTPVTMPWADQAKSIVQAWYGGNETGNGIADVLFGDVNPCGKLSVSFPRHLSDNPSYLNWGSERGRVLYGEDVYVGYRYYDKVNRPALFPFGYGLSYTRFKLQGLQVSTGSKLVTVSVLVRNIGATYSGAEVVQVYVEPRSPSVKRPQQELKGFQKVWLPAQTTERVTIEMELKYAASFWDEERDAWIVEKGYYTVRVWNSSGPQAYLVGGFRVNETWWWNGL